MEHWENLSLEDIIESIDGITYIEEWRTILNYEDYLASSFGRIKSLKHNKERILKQRYNEYGYLTTCLCKNNKIKVFFVHRLVASCFIPNPENKLEINHKRGIKTDNRPSELEWATRTENMRHSVKMGLHRAGRSALGKFGKYHNRSIPILQYDKSMRLVKEWESASEANRSNPLFTASGICIVCNGKAKTSAGFIWRYKYPTKTPPSVSESPR